MEKNFEHLAKLAKIYFEKEELENFQKEFIKILEFVKKLEELDLKEAKPLSQPLDLENVEREDQEKIFEDEKMKEKLKQSFCERKGDFLKVKKIL
jgi:aspartyl-tRNA(Asn)/glutamyl-tRNA(Gln) amidotransferase subunit C